MRIAIIGPEDVNFHFKQILNISKGECNSHQGGIAEVIAALGIELVVKQTGIGFEIAKRVRRISDASVLGIVSKETQDSGNLEFNRKAPVRPLFTGFIELKDAMKHLVCLFGDAVLILGYSTLAMAELCNALHTYGVINGGKRGMGVLHPQMRAGIRQPFSVIVYQPFVEEKLAKEIVAYMERDKVRVAYARTQLELKRTLLGANKSFL